MRRIVLRWYSIRGLAGWDGRLGVTGTGRADARPQAAVVLDMGQGLAERYAVKGRMNQIVIEHLDLRAWRAKPPGDRARAIAAIFCHVHKMFVNG